MPCDTQKGLHAFIENWANETFEQGFAVAEFVVTPDLKDIAGLRVADSKDVVYRRNAQGVSEPWYRANVSAYRPVQASASR